MSNKVYYTIRKQFQISKEKFTKNKILYNNCKTINHFPNNYNKILQPKIIHRKNHTMPLCIENIQSNVVFSLKSAYSGLNEKICKIVFEESKNRQDSNNHKNRPEDPKNNILFMCLMAFSIYICNKHTI